MDLLKTFAGIDITSIVNNTVNAISSKIKTPMTPEQQIELEKTLTNFLTQEDIAQTTVNNTEATNPNIFISGWRPFVGWTCGVAFFLMLVLFPICKVSIPTFITPDINWQSVTEVLFGLLGISGLRTYEKVKGVSNIH